MKVHHFSENLDFQQIASVLNKGKSAIPPLLNGLELLSSASDEAKLFAENFSKNSNIDYSDISLSVFDRLQIFLQLYLIELQRLLTGLLEL